MDGVTKALLGVIRIVLALLPLMLTVWGWAEWIENPGTLPRGMRQYAIAAGLGAALIASLCFVGVILSPRNAIMGSWDNYEVASAWGRVSLPLSILAVALGLLGKGTARWLLSVGGGCLVLVWVRAFIH
jgi:hypothetical protein